jgi:ATP-dependent HslUV protease subunit HslV
MKHIIRSTTVIGVMRDGKIAMGSDGQVTMGESMVMKSNAKKVRKIYNNEILVGFAGSTADAFTLLQRFEEKVEANRGNLMKASIEMAKDWRIDKYLRKLEAMLVVMNKKEALLISGTGDVIEPEEGIVTIGSGGPYALAAAQAMLHHTKLSARDIVEESLKIAGNICIFTNTNLTIEEL